MGSIGFIGFMGFIGFIGLIGFSRHLLKKAWPKWRVSASSGVISLSLLGRGPPDAQHLQGGVDPALPLIFNHA